MFYETGYNSSNFTLDLSNFDTSKVTNMSYMFRETGYNSTNFNTSITIKNPNIYSHNYNAMFKDVATQPGSKIIVNYTSETEALVDKMIATKSANSNVVKGWNVDVPITFTVEGTTYKAYEGMTWEQWVDSEFNTEGYKILYSTIGINGSYFISTDGSNKVNYQDLIIKYTAYSIINPK